MSSSGSDVIFNLNPPDPDDIPPTADSFSDVTFNPHPPDPNDIPPTMEDEVISIEEEIQIEYQVQEQFDSYLSLSMPWLVEITTRLLALYPGTTVAGILPAISFAELGLPSYEALQAIMVPHQRAGSYARYVLKLLGPQTIYFLIKEVNPEYGENEVKVGTALRKLNLTTTFIPALFGVHGDGYATGSPAYYIVVPFLKNTITLDSFIKNGKPNLLELSTVTILKSFLPLLKDLWNAWQRARFTHMDSKANQIIVTTAPFALYLVDFGHSCIDVEIENTQYRVMPRNASTKDFQSDTTYLLDYALHTLVVAPSPNRNTQLVVEWAKMRSAFSKGTKDLGAICAWLETK